MIVEELIEKLQECDPDAEVRFASQPKWPFEYSIDGAHECDLRGLSVSEMDEIYECIDDEAQEAREKGEEYDRHAREAELITEYRRDVTNGELGVVVYLEEGRQIGYLPTLACEVLGWR